MKKKIITLIENQLNKSLKSFEASEEVLKDSADLDEESTRELDDYSQQSSDQDMQQRLQLQTANVEEKIDWMERNASISQQTVQPGALVETKDEYFFIGIALPTNIEAEGKKVTGISEDAPVYASIEGKKKGEEITLGNQTYKIINIY